MKDHLNQGSVIDLMEYLDQEAHIQAELLSCKCSVVDEKPVFQFLLGVILIVPESVLKMMVEVLLNRSLSSGCVVRLDEQSVHVFSYVGLPA
jgi:hypothetical protein